MEFYKVQHKQEKVIRKIVLVGMGILIRFDQFVSFPDLFSFSLIYHFDALMLLLHLSLPNRMTVTQVLPIRHQKPQLTIFHENFTLLVYV